MAKPSCASRRKDFYIVGMKSYGRAPTFLAATGYEQVRSVAAALCGDWEAARDVQLNLPETGVCVTDYAADAGLLRARRNQRCRLLLAIDAIPVVGADAALAPAQPQRCC